MPKKSMIASRASATVLILIAGLLAGCAGSAERPVYPQISFAHLSKIALDVARVDVASTYVSPATEPNVEHRFPVSPAASAMNWGRDRLQPVGSGGVARVTLERASVVEVPLEKTKGVRGAFTNDQAERYDGVITMSVEILNDAGERQGIVRATAQRSQTVPENISLNEREKVWFEMTEKMMATINQALEGQVRTHLKDWLK